MPVEVHLSGSTTARVVLAVALLAALLFCAPALLLWPIYPDRVGCLVGFFGAWTRVILEPTGDATAIEPGAVAAADPEVIELSADGADPPVAA